ncbi:MAG: beta-ketoacyl reductase, partial [Nannocystaceae bacterium]
LASRGMRSLRPDEGITALARLLGENRAHVGVVPFDVRQWVEFYPAAATSRTLSRLRSAAQTRASSAQECALASQLAAMSGDARAALIAGTLRAQASQVLRIPEDVLDVHAPLTSLGLDSLMGLELRNRVEATLGIKVPVTLLWTYPTVAALAAHLGAEADAEQPAATMSEPEAEADIDIDIDAEDLEDEIEDMSEEELALLIEGEFEAMQ